MHIIDSIDALEVIYDEVSARAKRKVVDHITPHYKSWLDKANFCILTTIGKGGTDASPRGDEGSVVRIANDKTVYLPDWRGNNRLDSLGNIVEDGRVSLLFMVAGSGNVVRINGTAVVSDDASLCASFSRRAPDGKKEISPKTVIIVTVGEIYFQCSRAIARSGLWEDISPPSGLPSAGDFLAEVEENFDGQQYDVDWQKNFSHSKW